MIDERIRQIAISISGLAFSQLAGRLATGPSDLFGYCVLAIGVSAVFDSSPALSLSALGAGKLHNSSDSWD